MIRRRSLGVFVLGSAAVAVAVLAAGFIAVKAIGVQSDRRCGTPHGAAVCRVLFIGDSYTYVNNLPAVFASLARAGHQSVSAEEIAGAGESLADHVDSGDATRALRSSKWNVVVLQEQSQIPASARLRQTEMSPAARDLAGMIRAAGARPMLFVAWAERYGWPEDGLNYWQMQSAVDDGYLTVAHEVHAAIAPVGYAWAATLKRERSADRHAGLWRPDGSHPTARGTYLAACVFYAAIFDESPIGLSYHYSLLGGEAMKLQRDASESVLGQTAR
jgi:hypothetical protein